MRTAIGQRLAEDDALAPGAALDQRRAEHDDAQRAPVALAPGQQPVDEQPERALELGARGGLLELERLLEDLAGTARAQRRVAPAREVVGQQPGRPKRSATAARGSAASAPSVAIPRRSSSSGSAASSARWRSSATRSRGQAVGAGDEARRAARAPARRRPRSRRSATGRRPGASRRRRSPAQRLARGVQHPVERAAVQAPQAARLEAGQPRAAGLDQRADRLQAPPARAPRRRPPRRDRAARAPAAGSAPAPPPCRMPGWMPKRLGRRRDLAHQLLAARLGGQGGRALQQRLARARRRRRARSGGAGRRRRASNTCSHPASAGTSDGRGAPAARRQPITY